LLGSVILKEGDLKSDQTAARTLRPTRRLREKAPRGRRGEPWPSPLERG